MKNKIVLLVLALTCFMLYLNGMITEVHNTKKEIEACMGKVQLTLVRTWGGDEVEKVPDKKSVHLNYEQ
jgi:hypothetical protein